MRRLLFCLPVATMLLLFFSFEKTPLVLPLPAGDNLSFNNKDVIGCGPSSTAEIFFDSSRKMVPLPGWGQHQWKIETAYDSAQFYFNQGLNLFYSFHMQEARASFLEAQRHDPGCAMAYWGQAMAEGPFINAPVYTFNNPSLRSLLQKAEALAKNELEKTLIQAQQLRFTSVGNTTLKDLAVVYKNRMQQLYAKHPENTEVAVLYADALMQVEPRNWYTEKGAEKEGTAEIVSLLETILAAKPDHPAALHYYIHMVEPSTQPGRAKEEADRLLPLLPSVTHMVHMPSHIYVRTGDYRKGIRSNEEAVRGYTAFRNVLKGWEGSRYLYFFHNVDMQGANASLMGNYAETKKAYGLNLSQFSSSDAALYSIPSLTNVVQFATAQMYLTDVRFGNWKKILQSKGPVSSRPYHRLLWQFGRGMALAKTGSMDGAEQCLAMVKALLNDSSLYTIRPNRNRAIDAANIAMLVLEGTIHAEQKRWDDAIRLFEAAVKAEDGLRYSEPEDWRLPARHYLGQVYLLKGEPAKAQTVFEEDLLDHPRNYWALNGLYAALLRQQKKAAALRLKQQHQSVFAAAATTRPLMGAAY
jgi:tetratricopeptide (TPR) repeat protein